MQKTARMASDAEKQVVSLVSLRERLLAMASQPISQGISPLNGFLEDFRKIQKEAAERVRRLAENERLRKSRLPPTLSGEDSDHDWARTRPVRAPNTGRTDMGRAQATDRESDHDPSSADERRALLSRLE